MSEISQSRVALAEPMELVGAALSQPLVSLVLAAIVAGSVLILTSSHRRRGPALDRKAARTVNVRYLPEHRTLGVAAGVVVVVFVAQSVILGYLVDLAGTIPWWRHATPILCATIATAVTLALILIRGTTAPESPVLPGTRRTWLSFGPRAGLIAAAVVLLTLAATTVAAGIASAPDGEGRYVWLVIPIPNEAEIDPLRLPFYGWVYGVPVLVGLGALAGLTWAALHSNAARPYIRPETVPAEQDARRDLARGVVHVATAGALLALAGAWRLIARAGSGSLLTIEGQNSGDPYEVAWRYAELAVAAGWAAPVLEIAGFALLILVAARLLSAPSADAPNAPRESAEAEAVR